MGYYLNRTTTGSGLPAIGKAQVLINDGAVQIEEPKEWVPNLICIVRNSVFEAAGYCYNESEFNVFADPRDQRKKVWLIKEDAAVLADYPS